VNPGFILPPTYVITADGPVDATWWDRFRKVLERGHLMVQLRLKSLPEAELRSVVARAAGLARRANASCC
jgi:thiamine monophosphate synthase